MKYNIQPLFLSKIIDNQIVIQQTTTYVHNFSSPQKVNVSPYPFDIEKNGDLFEDANKDNFSQFLALASNIGIF